MTGLLLGSMPAPSIATPSRLSWSGGSGVGSPAAGTLRMYAMTAWISLSLSLLTLVYDMTVSQWRSASTPLRIARKISPSDQRLNAPAGVRFADTIEPIGIG